MGPAGGLLGLTTFVELLSATGVETASVGVLKVCADWRRCHAGAANTAMSAAIASVNAIFEWPRFRGKDAGRVFEPSSEFRFCSGNSETNGATASAGSDTISTDSGTVAVSESDEVENSGTLAPSTVPMTCKRSIPLRTPRVPQRGSRSTILRCREFSVLRGRLLKCRKVHRR